MVKKNNNIPKVRLISITKPVAKKIKKFTPEELITYIARISNPNNQLNTETSDRLLKYCVKHAHWSIFEHVFFTVEITTSVAIATQILRHKSAFFQQFSARYQSVTSFETYPARRQDDKNRQNSVDDMSDDDKDWFLKAQQEIQNRSLELYNDALSRGVAKEQSRFLLSQSATTTMYMTNNLRNWIHYISIRTDPTTQKEHRDIALKIKTIFIRKFPVIAKALEWV